MTDASASLRDGISYLRAGSLDRAARAFESAVEAADDPAVRSEALRRRADVHRRRAEWDEADRRLLEAVQIARLHALRDHVAAALNIGGAIRIEWGDYEAAIARLHDALREEPGARQRGMICQNLGTAHALRAERDAAADWYARSADAFAEAGCVREQLLVLNNRGSVRMDQGDDAAAERIFREALRTAQDLPQGEAELQAISEVNLAESLARQRTRLEEAYELLMRAIGHFAAAKNLPLRVACHRVFALVTEAQGYPELALGALERGLELAREVRSGPETAYFERELRRVRESSPGSTLFA